MRIVNRESFLALPKNTVFSKYTSGIFEGIQIKDETWSGDFIYQSISDALQCSGPDEFRDILDRAPLTGEMIRMDFHALERDGCFDSQQLFAVWDKNDVLALVERLKACVPSVL